MALNVTDKRWLALLRRPVILGMVLSLLETGPTRPVQLARVADLPASTALYQVKTMRDAGLIVRGDEASPTRIRLADPQRVLDLLRAYHPTPDAITEFAQMWANAIKAVAGTEAAPEAAPPASEVPVAYPPSLVGAAPSVKTVYAALASGPLTGKDIGLETGLGRRTVYTALNALRELGLIEQRPHLTDMRQMRFSLKDADTAAL